MVATGGLAAQKKSNNFNLLRLIAASSVIFHHAWDVTAGIPDALQRAIGYSIGWIAVSAFFSMSGYLIYNSAIRSRTAGSYLSARCFRIFPGLWVMLLVTTLSLGALSSLDFNDYLLSGETAKYILGNAVLYAPQYHLPGVFEGNTLPQAVNGSLWTLRFEFTCYLLVITLALAGFFRKESLFRAFAVAFAISYLAYLGYGYFSETLDKVLYDGKDIAKMHRLFMAFFVGMVFARYSFFPSFRIVALAAIVSFLLFDTLFFSTALIWLSAVIVFWIAFLKGGAIFTALRKIPDISYGIYIYAFPIQQAFAYLFPAWTPAANAWASLFATIIPATFSWYLIEKPSLNFKDRIRIRNYVP